MNKRKRVALQKHRAKQQKADLKKKGNRVMAGRR